MYLNTQGKHSFRIVSKDDYDVYASVWAVTGCSGKENGYCTWGGGRIY